jgi:hypothetical protein
MNDHQFKTFDFPMCLYLAAKTKFEFINDVTAVFRYHANQTTSISDPRKRFEFGMSHVYMRKKFIAMYPEHYFLWEGIKTALAAEIFEMSFLNNYKRGYGIIAYRFLQKYHHVNAMQRIQYWVLKGYVNMHFVSFMIKVLRKIHL